MDSAAGHRLALETTVVEKREKWPAEVLPAWAPPVARFEPA
jgi:hypothetical protein